MSGPSSSAAVADKGEFLHYTFQRFQCLTQIMRRDGKGESSMETGQ